MTDENPDRVGREEWLEEFGPAAFGDRLVITVTGDDPVDDLYQVADRAEAGEAVPARISLPPEELRRLLTSRRLELIETIMDHSPGSIRACADLVDRSYPSVHEDLELLADLGIVVFRREGRANRPVIPYDRIEYSGVISAREVSA